MNRYTKNIGDTIKFKNFPLDENGLLRFQEKFFSALIHEALLRRINFKNYKPDKN